MSLLCRIERFGDPQAGAILLPKAASRHGEIVTGVSGLGRRDAGPNAFGMGSSRREFSLKELPQCRFGGFRQSAKSPVREFPGSGGPEEGGTIYWVVPGDGSTPEEQLGTAKTTVNPWQAGAGLEAGDARTEVRYGRERTERPSRFRGLWLQSRETPHKKSHSRPRPPSENVALLLDHDPGAMGVPTLDQNTREASGTATSPRPAG